MTDDRRREQLRQTCVVALRGLDELRAALIRGGHIPDKQPEHSPEVQKILDEMRRVPIE